MPEIPLTKNQVTIVSDIDYDYLNQWKWYAAKRDDIFYACRTDYLEGRQRMKLMHRIIIQRKGDDPSPRYRVRHLDGDTLNNRRENLSIIAKRVGVCYNKTHGKWQAQIGVNGERIHLGLFKTFEDAVNARIRAEEMYWK